MLRRARLTTACWDAMTGSWFGLTEKVLFASTGTESEGVAKIRYTVGVLIVDCWMSRDLNKRKGG